MKLTDEMLRKLKEHEDNEASLAEQKLKEEFMQIAKGLLVQVWPEEEVDLNLEYYVTGEGEEIDSRQPDNLTPEQQEKLDEILKAMSSLHELYKQCRAQWSTCYLFLNAPYETPKRNLGEDKQANTRQNQNMYNIMHPSTAEKEKNPRVERVVTKQEHIRQALQQTFHEVALKTRRITIVFNGEGDDGDSKFKKGSLCLQEDDPMSMEEFVRHVLSIWEETIKREAVAFIQREDTSEQGPRTMVEPMDVSDSGETTKQPTDIMSKLDYTKILDTIPPFPASVTVIFGQCFSCFHKLDETTLSDWGSRFDIFAPTDAEGKGVALCTYTFDAPFRQRGIVRFLIESNHPELEEVAKRYQQAVQKIHTYQSRLF